MNSFKQFEISKEQTDSTKGGIFCELYIGYAESRGTTANPTIMARAEQLDATLRSRGWWAALQQGAGMFMSYYN